MQIILFLAPNSVDLRCKEWWIYLGSSISHYLTISLSQPPTPGLLSIFLCFKLVSDLFLPLDAFLLQMPKRQKMQTLIAFYASLLIASITNRAKQMQSQDSQFFDIWDNFQVYGSTLCEHWTFLALHISNLLKAASS